MGRRTASDAVSELAFALELLGEAAPSFARDTDAAATANLAWPVRQLDPNDPLAVQKLTGVTPLLASVIDDALHDRPSPALSELKRGLPPGLFELRKVKGLGSKKVQRLWRELGIESLGELEYACKENRLVTLDGFGEKTQVSVLSQLAALAAEAGLMRRDYALSLTSEVVEIAKTAGARVIHAGALRRGAELIDEVVLAADRALGDVALPARVRVVVAPPGRFGAALVVATGSDAHVQALRARAAARGLDLDAIDGDDEAAVYAALGLAPTAPELREHGALTEIGSARPRLITRTDLRGALHNHTTDSDGVDSLATMLAAAQAAGLAWLGIADHSAAAAYAHGVDAARLAAQRAAIAQAPGPVRALSGVEADILRDGALDLDDDGHQTLGACDVVIASMHQRFGLSAAAQTARLTRAAQHPLADVIGHPTGRLLLARAPAEFDMSALIEACVVSGAALELNANPARLDLSVAHLALAKERGVLVSIAADAHAAAELDNLEHGVAVARRAGLTVDDVLNVRDADDVLAWVRLRRARAAAATGAGASP